MFYTSLIKKIKSAIALNVCPIDFTKLIFLLYLFNYLLKIFLFVSNHIPSYSNTFTWCFDPVQDCSSESKRKCFFLITLVYLLVLYFYKTDINVFLCSPCSYVFLLPTTIDVGYDPGKLFSSAIGQRLKSCSPNEILSVHGEYCDERACAIQFNVILF